MILSVHVCICIDCKHYKSTYTKSYDNNEHVDNALYMTKDIDYTIKYIQSLSTVKSWYTTMLTPTYQV